MILIILIIDFIFMYYNHYCFNNNNNKVSTMNIIVVILINHLIGFRVSRQQELSRSSKAYLSVTDLPGYHTLLFYLLTLP